LVLRGTQKRSRAGTTKHPVQVRSLENWLPAVAKAFADCILPIDEFVVDEWGRMGSGRPVPTIDAGLAPTTEVHAMTLVSRNTADVADLGTNVLNPFESRM